MQEIPEFQQNILSLDGYATTGLIATTNILIVCRVKPDPSDYKLEIGATDVKQNYWECIWGIHEFSHHQDSIGVTQKNWRVYFDLLATALSNKPILATVRDHDLYLQIEYPIAQAQLRGEIILKNTPDERRTNITDLVFRGISGLEPKISLKRPRPSSPELSQMMSQPKQAEIPKAPKAKPKPGGLKKKPKSKQIGSKIA